MYYQYNEYIPSYINPAWEQDYLLMLKKEQERIAIRGILKGMKSTIRQKGQTQEVEFQTQSRAIKDYLGQIVAKNLEEAYTGLAAQNVQTYLEGMEEPTFASPMK